MKTRMQRQHNESWKYRFKMPHSCTTQNRRQAFDQVSHELSRFFSEYNNLKATEMVAGLILLRNEQKLCVGKQIK